MPEKLLLPPDHLGDGVYVHDGGYELILAVNHHNNKVIHMEKHVIEAFINYAKRSGIIKE
jgi:hypothetical protein